MDVPSVAIDGLCGLAELDTATFANVVDGVYDVLSKKITTQVQLQLFCLMLFFRVQCF